MRVLFVTKEYLPKPTPPGLCIMHVQRALLDRGVQSDVLMASDSEGLYCHGDYGDVYSIKSGIAFEKKKESFFDYLKVHVPMLFTWPVPSYKRVNDYRRTIKELDSDRHYDSIIGTMFPPDVCVACSVFDHFFYYELDSLINNPVYKSGIKKYMGHRLTKLEEKLFDRAELIIHLNNNRIFYRKEKYKKYEQKSVYSDIPYLIKSKPEKGETAIISEDISDDQLLMIYSGHLSKDYRPPFKLIELIKQISKRINVKCLFFSRGDCEDALRQAEIDTNGAVKRMGYVSQEVLSGYTDRADFLLDIGNRLSGEDYSLPSKVIDYMSMGKPIIHMNGVNDSAIQYLEKYGLALNVPEEFDEAYINNSVMPFIERSRGKIQDFSEVAEKFPQNTPGYTANLIIDAINRRNAAQQGMRAGEDSI